MSDNVALEPDVLLAPAMTAYKARRAAGLFELRPRDKLLAEYMTVGTSHARAARLGLPLNQPLSLEQAASVLDIRRRNARQIFALPAFQALYSKKIADMRCGAHARMVKHMVSIADDEGDNSAATKSVRLKAAKSVLGEQETLLNVSVVQNNVQQPVGYHYENCSRPVRPTIETERIPDRPVSDLTLLRRERERRELAAIEVERARPDPTIFRPLGYP
jgi:hypothetical protein